MKKNLRFRVMLITAVIGFIATAVFVSVVDSDAHFKLILGQFLYYPLAFLVISGGFRWKWKGNATWVATLTVLPCWVALFGPLIIEPMEFLKWYAFVGITTSVMIFEYKLLD